MGDTFDDFDFHIDFVMVDIVLEVRVVHTVAVVVDQDLQMVAVDIDLDKVDLESHKSKLHSLVIFQIINILLR